MASDAPPAYGVESRNRVNRYRKRAVYDQGFVHSVVNEAHVAHVAFPPALDAGAESFPALLPMIAVMAQYKADDEDAPFAVYLHGYVSSRVMRLASTGDDGETRFPVTVCASIVDGLVLSLTPFSHDYNYRSAVIQGYGTVVADPDEKLWAMREITNKVLPQRWEHVRAPPSATEMKTTNILKVSVVGASGKHRHGQPHEERQDLQDTAVQSSVWTGVVPVWAQYGAPLRAEAEAKDAIPTHVTEAVSQHNKQRQEHAIGAVKE